MSRLFSNWAVVAILTLLAVALRIWDPTPISQLRLMAFDTYQRLGPRIFTPDLPVRIIDIDDASLKRFGQWPWPRTRLAELVNRLNDLGAAAIGFDFVFSEPDRTSPEEILAELPPGPDLARLAEFLASRRSNDEAFAAAMAKGNVVLGTVLNTSGGGATNRPPVGFAYAGDDPRAFVPEYTGVTGNLEVLENAAQGLGMLNWVPDGDQIVRRLPLLGNVDGELYPALTTELLRVAQGAGSYLIKSSGANQEEAFGASTGIVALRVGDIVLPTAANGEIWIHYSGQRKARTIPAWKILTGETDAAQIEGRIMLVGTSAPGLFDLRATPIDAAIPGVEVHAEGLEQMIAGTPLIRPDFALAIELGALVVIGLIVAVLIGLAGPQWTGLVALVALGAANWFSWDAFANRGWLIDPVYPSLMTVAIYMAGTVVGYIRTERQRNEVRRAFSYYLAPALVEDLADHPEHLVLGGEERDLTVLFSDIRGFTGISEHMGPVQLTDFINRFLTPMTEVILERKGTIDKYMGDAVMAFWNAPIDDADHAGNACRAALEMHQRLARLNREFAEEAAAGAAQGGLDLPPIRIGIGLNTGSACVGNLGSRQRFAYSAIGDDVNIASRLEGQTKAYGVDTLVSAATARAAPAFAFLELDHLKVVGREEPVVVYALLGDPVLAHSPDFGELEAANLEMLAAYRGRKWDQALALIATCAHLGGPPLELHYNALAKRVSAFKHRPPGPRWDGSVAARSK
ncbi:Adenylate cyclase [hydrothermal vent metagenome]|uniref:Adenylate cyclase n=1 Tax=hydrothermal vent metagenome TaxID=652676 RepID=A0A3B0SXD1_9ZZZZ